MKRFTGILLLCTMVLHLSLSPVVMAQTPSPTVVAVDMQGIQHAPAADRDKAADLIQALVGKPYEQAKVDEAMKAIEGIGVFFSASATQASVDGGVKLVVNLVENRVVSRIDFSGNISLTDKQLFALIKASPGQVLNDRQVRNDLIAMQEAYRNAGYIFTEFASPVVRTDEDNPGKVVLFFEIFEPSISEVRINGAKKTREYVIRRELGFHVGDAVNQNVRQASARNLLRLNIFENATITYEPGTQPGTLIANVNIKERSTGTASVGVSQSQVEGLTGSISLMENNLFGTTQRVSANVRIGGQKGYQFSYGHPWIDRHRTSMTVNLYDFSTPREAFVGAQESGIQYDEKRAGGDVTFSRPFGQDTRISFTLRNNTIKTTEDTLIDNDDIRDALIIDDRVLSGSLGLSRDTRNFPMRPYAGSFSALEAEVAGLSGTSFVKLQGEARRYFIVKNDREADAREEAGKFPRHWVLASRLKLGASTGMPPFLDQYFIGGSDTSSTLRGYKQDRFPGENMLLWNNELRVPLNESLDVVGFADLGDAWGGKFADKFGDSSFKLHYGYGVGIRLMLPAVGPLRLDYGINDEGHGEFTFAFGTTF